MYKLIASDMDETLLNDQHEIGQENIKWIKKACQEKGLMFVPATGRGYNSIQHNLKELGLYDQAGEYIISYNGGALTENKNNRLLDFKGLDFGKMKEIFEFGLNYDVCIHVYTKDKLYIYNLRPEEAVRIAEQKTACEIVTENTVDFLEKEPISKILYQNTDMDYLRSIEPKLRAITDGYCAVSYSSNRYLEFNTLGVNKGVGLQNLAQIVGLDMAEVIAVGDNFNDQAMLAVAGLSVAANNAVPEIKALCDYTTKANNNQGVIAEVIRKFIYNEDI